MPPFSPANDNLATDDNLDPATSSYLKHSPREIWQACHDVLAERGIWKSPCENCTLFTICKPPTDLIGVPAAE